MHALYNMIRSDSYINNMIKSEQSYTNNMMIENIEVTVVNFP